TYRGQDRCAGGLAPAERAVALSAPGSAALVRAPTAARIPRPHRGLVDGESENSRSPPCALKLRRNADDEPLPLIGVGGPATAGIAGTSARVPPDFRRRSSRPCSPGTGRTARATRPARFGDYGQAIRRLGQTASSPVTSPPDWPRATS